MQSGSRPCHSTWQKEFSVQESLFLVQIPLPTHLQEGLSTHQEGYQVLKLYYYNKRSSYCSQHGESATFFSSMYLQLGLLWVDHWQMDLRTTGSCFAGGWAVHKIKLLIKANSNFS